MSTMSEIRKIRSGITMGRCSLLRRAFALRESTDRRNQFREYVANIERLENAFRFDLPEGMVANLWPLVRTRIDLIEAVFNTGHDLEESVLAYVQAFDKCWHYRPQSFVSQLVPENAQPACAKFDGAVGLERIDEALELVVEQHGWDHPGVLMAAETIAMLSGISYEAEAKVTARIMFALPHRGILAKLRIERIDGGCGLLVPDPLRCGYLWLDESFSTGLQNAWWAARNFAQQQFGAYAAAFDWRWSIDLLSATNRLSDQERQVQIPIQGRSAEVVVACALIAAHQDNPDAANGTNPLDPHVSATASIAYPGDSERDELAPVSAIEDKTLLDEMYSKRLVEVVVARSQNGDTLPPDGRYEFYPAASLVEAYEGMTRHPRITRGVNRYFRRWASTHLTEQCMPYVEPEIKEVVEGKGRLGEDVDLRQAEVMPLVEDIDLLVTGNLEPGNREDRAAVSDYYRTRRWIGNRVRIFADSGLGKSMWMLYCQREIARRRPTVLPLRIGRTIGEDAPLSIRWNEGDVIRKLATYPTLVRAFEDYVRRNPHADRLSVEERVDWFRWMVRKGRVVLLIDALDQASSSVEGMGVFLGSADMHFCPVLVTGRPEAQQIRHEAFVENEWRTLRVEAFDRSRQEAYFGTELSDKLLLDAGNEEIRFDTSEQDLRKHQWRDLLGTPLLLHLLKMLATNEQGASKLGEIHSRHDLYSMAVDKLINKGWKTAQEEQKDLLRDDDNIREMLGKISWFLVRQHDFSGVLEGRQFMKFQRREDLPRNLVKALQQIDLTTASQVLDRADAQGLSFRHRSFLEYFAAQHLVEHFWDDDPSTCTRADWNAVLSEVHQIPPGDHPEMELCLKRLGDWQEVFRFALSSGNEPVVHQLACQLISHGNPWIVFQAIKRDKIALSSQVDALCRWLVHRDWPHWFDFRDAATNLPNESICDLQAAAIDGLQIPEVDPAKMLQPGLRDSAYLASLREISSPAGWYTEEKSSTNAAMEIDLLHRQLAGRDFRDTFYQIQAGRFDVTRYHKYSQIHEVDIGEFALAEFPVTNALFEKFCPSHLRQRDQFSPGDDSPATQVNWYMATEFCLWLSDILGETYRLPTEWEWEWACRWHDTRRQRYWWGSKVDDAKCWDRETSARTGTCSWAATHALYSSPTQAHPSWQSSKRVGLLDLHGNVWEWCSVWQRPGSYRVLRGGSWNYLAGFGSSSFRLDITPDNRYFDVGFRLCRE